MELKSVLEGKKVLFIGVNFYHFTAEITDALEAAGASVSFYYERDISKKFALVNFLFRKYLDNYQDQHYRRILLETRERDFDYLLVIRGYKMQGWFVEQIKKDHPGIKTILYQWDAVDNWECDYRHLIPHFDSTSTFDIRDSKNLQIPYIPTFYTNEVPNLKSSSYDCDLFYFGNYTEYRYQVLLALSQYAALNGYKLKSHIYLSKWRFFVETIRGVKINRKLVRFFKMDKDAYLSSFAKARVIVDVATSTQSGLTMRVIDALGAGKQIITNNEFIKQDPAYDSNQIHIFDPGNIHIPKDFITSNRFIRKDYSIARWLHQLFSTLNVPIP